MKDYELHLVLNDPKDPIHNAIDASLDRLHPRLEESTMTHHEKKLVKEAIARTRYELGDRKSSPGMQDWCRQGPGRVTPDEARWIRDAVRDRVGKDEKSRQKAQ